MWELEVKELQGDEPGGLEELEFGSQVRTLSVD